MSVTRKPTTFAALGLSSTLQAAVRGLDWETPTPIQRGAIPPLLEGRDLVGIASTGTGKTGAFMIPALQRIRAGGGLQALVLCPTRELAQQVRDDAQALAGGTGIRASVIVGGVGYSPQIEALERGDEVIAATPGRLIDLQGRGHARFKGLRTLILDEADRLLDMGFRPQINEVVRGLRGAKRQTLLFSATMPNPVHDLALRLTRDPIWVEVTPSGTKAEGISERAYSVKPQLKPDLLAHLLTTPGWDQVLVFTRTKVGADVLVSRLRGHRIRCGVIHGNRQMKERTKAVESFREGKVRVLVATDIAQRGLDISGISHVVNYDVPLDPDDYTHRIGRTGRAGATGEAITFIASSDLGAFRTLEQQLERRIPRIHHPDFDYAGSELVAGESPTAASPLKKVRSRSGRGMGSRAGDKLTAQELEKLLSHGASG